MTITLHPNLSRDWSLRNEILERMQKEDNIRWALREPSLHTIPKYEPPKKVPKGVVWGLISSILP